MLQAVAFLVCDFLRSLLCWWQCHGASRYVTIRLVGQLITVIINGRGGSNPCSRKLFFGKVCTDLIEKTSQRKPRQTRAIAGIVKKNSLHQQTKKPLFFQFYGLKRGSLKNTFHSAARGGEFSRVLSGTINTTGRQTRRFSLFMKIFREKSDPFFFSVTHCLIVKSSKKERI